MFGQTVSQEQPKYERKYVRVIADHLADGCVIPRILYWEDEDGLEIPYKISNKPKGRPAHSRKAGGQGLLYVVDIQGKSKELYYDDFEGRFFVEKVV